jgi:hypothetical protein
VSRDFDLPMLAANPRLHAGHAAMPRHLLSVSTPLLAMHGRISDIDAELLVVLRAAVKPQHAGNLGLFRFAQDQKSPNK